MPNFPTPPTPQEKDGRLFLKDARLFKKDGGVGCNTWCRNILHPITATNQVITPSVYEM